MSTPGPDEDLESLVMECLAAADPHAELERRTEGRPSLRLLALQVLEQTQRLEGTEAPPPVIPDVVLEGLIARGGQAAVYRGRQQYLERPVAVKVLDEQRDPAFVKRFRLEARTLAQLSHPHIVTCHQAGVTADGHCYLVMELIDGPTLRRWLNEHGPLPVATALAVTRALAEALAAAQAAGIVHRDVKPENVLLKPRAAVPGEPLPFAPKLADLGLARVSGTGPAGTMLTRAGMLLGTPETMAPEQIDEPAAADHRADVYGLGCVLHHMLAGRPAFAGTMSQILAAKAVQAHPDLASVSGLSPGVASLLRDMLARDPADRPQSYSELLVRLQKLQPLAKPRGQGLRIAAIVAVLVAAAVLLVRQFAPSQVPAVPAADPMAAPLAEGNDRPLFQGGEGPMALWQLTAATDWGRDDQVPAGATGALLNCKQGSSEASCRLPPGSWELTGGIEPRPYWTPTSPSVNLEAAGMRLLFAGGHAVALELSPATNVAGEAAGEPVSYRARLLHVQRSAAGAWAEVREYGVEQAPWGRANPLQLRCTWHANALTCSWGSRQGPTAVTVHAADWGGDGPPTALSLYVVKGNVCFSDFTLRGR